MLLSLQKKSRRAIRLIIITFLYLIFGAFTFGYFEHEADNELRQEIKDSRQKLQLKYNFTIEDFDKIEKTIIDLIPYKAGRQWNFFGASYFAVIVITTVGYGHSTPQTILGKVFYMFYALFGIPLGLVTFQSSGERINNVLKSLLLKLRAILSKLGIYVLKEVKARHLLMISLNIGFATIAIGTFVFHKKEEWSIFDSFYYCVITFTTIGLGDRVSAQTKGRLENDPFYVLFILTFILGGLAIFSSCVNLLILEFMASNADIITARGRIRKLLQRSTSFKTATFNSFSSLTTRNQKSNKSPKPVSVKKETDDKPPNVYLYYRRQKKPNFSIRRPASVYIEHLVNTSKL